MSGSVAGIVLAAGESRRFGGRKQLATLDRRTLLEHVLELADHAGLDPIVAVVPVWLTRPPAFPEPRHIWVRNPHPAGGMSHSLRLGFAALPPRAEAAVVLLGDQPTLPAAQIAALIAARGDRPLIATRVDGHPTPPVLVERTHFDLVGAAVGDAGLRDVLGQHPEWVKVVAMHEGVPDIDTRADLDALRDR